eukprot:6076985-Amphidinium_carterae.1
MTDTDNILVVFDVYRVCKRFCSVGDVLKKLKTKKHEWIKMQGKLQQTHRSQSRHNTQDWLILVAAVFCKDVPVPSFLSVDENVLPAAGD